MFEQLVVGGKVELFKKSRRIRIIGDASKVGNLRTVVWQAWKLAQKL